MHTCPKCQFSYHQEAVPGGHCPRCLLTALEDPGFLSGSGLALSNGDLADEELMAELPDFDIIECLGRGGMGVVWKARERVLDRHVAVKLLLNPEKDQAFVERFTREARIMARLSHPHIVSLYSFGRTRSGHCYLVMELVEGTNLARLMDKGILSLPQSLQVVTEVCAALQHAHEAGYIHRDIKPANVLLDGKGRVKVGDFGLARLSAHLDTTTLHLTKQGFSVGTPHYMAPEQEHGKGEVDHRADIYSLGVMFYQMLTGDLPRGVFSPPSQKSKVDVRLDKVVLRALHDRPENRYQRVADVITELQVIRETADPVLRAEKEALRKARLKRSRLEMTFAGLAALLVGIISAWYARGWMDGPPQAALRGGAQAGGGLHERDGSLLPAGDGIRIAREVRLQPAGLGPAADFGRSIAMSGEWLVVGASRGGQQGSVYCYRRGGSGTWRLVQQISNPAGANGGLFGYSVALGDGRLVVGSPVSGTPVKPGNAWVYKLKPATGQWVTEGALPEDGGRTEIFGYRVAAVGGAVGVIDLRGGPKGRLELFSLAETDDPSWETSIIADAPAHLMPGVTLLSPGEAFISLSQHGATGASDGILRLLAEAGSKTWKQELIRPEEHDGVAPIAFPVLAAEGGQLVAGSPNAAGNHGLAWVFHRDTAGHYHQEACLTPPPEFGAGETGRSVAVHGDWIALGADHAEVDANHRGGVAVYHRQSSADAAAWDMALKLKADPAVGANAYGLCVLIDGQKLVVSAPQSLDDEGQVAGAVFVYELAEPLK